ncbi:MAG: HdeA/HdeB family chaperone [Steroidobacteraceae bacterium]
MKRAFRPKPAGAARLLACLSPLLACLAPLAARAAEVNLATLSCDKYENEIIGSPDAAQGGASHLDAIDTVMWLFGFSVAKAGGHVMYGDALTSFGFALDAVCKNSPSTSLLEALTSVTPKRDKPMDLTSLNCATWEARHQQSAQSDPESANTIMMWLFGFSVGQSGSHLFDPAGVTSFAAALQKRCEQHPDDNLYDALAALTPKRGSSPTVR